MATRIVFETHSTTEDAWQPRWEYLLVLRNPPGLDIDGLAT